MASADGSIRIRTDVDTTGIKNGTKSIESGVQKMNNSFLKLAGTMATVFSVAALINFGKQAINLASDLQEVQNVVDVAFGDMAYKIEEFANSAIENFGLSELSAKSMASTFMAMANGMGQGLDVASDMAVELTGRLADIMSFYNKSISEVETIGRAVYSGETEPLKAIGVIMTEAQLQTFALAHGYQQLYKDMSAADKLLVRQQYFLETTNQAAGDFLRTQDSWANQTRILSERWKEFLTLVGGRLIQVLAPVVTLLNNLLSSAIAVGNALAKIFGWETSVASSTGAIASNVSDTADSQEELTNSTNSTNKALKKQLAFFDDINVLASESASVGSGGGAGTSTGTGPTGSGQLVETTKTEENLSKLELKLKGFFDSFNKFIQPIKDALSDLWNNGLKLFGKFSIKALKDFYDDFLVPVGKWVVGKGFPDFVNYINDLLIRFDWNKLEKNLDKLWKGLEPFAKSVGTGLIEFAKDLAAISLAGVEVIGSILGGIGDGLKWITGSSPAFFEGLAYAVASLVTALIGFQKVVALEASLKTFGATMSASILTHPYLAVATGVLALVGAFYGFAKATENQKELELYGDTIENISSAFRVNSEEIQNSIDASKDYVNDAGLAETAMADDLADKYFDLAEQASLTNNEKLLMKQYATELVDILPELSNQIDAETGLLTVQRGEVDSLIESTKDYYRLQAGRSKLLQAYSDQIDAEEDLRKQKELTNTASDLYNAAVEETNRMYEEALAKGNINEFLQTSEWTIATDNLESYKNQFEDLSDNLAIAEQRYANTSEQIQWLNSIISESSTALNNVDFVKLTTASINAIDSAHGIWMDGKQILGQDAINIYDEIMAGLTPLEDGSYQLANGSIVAFGNALSVGSESVKQTVNDTYIATLQQALSDGYTVAYDESGKLVIAYVDGMNAKKQVALNAWSTYGTDVSRSFLGSLKKGIEDSIPIFEEIAKALWIPFNNIPYNPALNKLPSNVTIPHLATGAVIPPNREFMAVLGDQKNGTNIEAPLDTIVQAFKNVVSSGNIGSSNSGQPLILNIDGQEFARITLPGTLSEMDRQGYNTVVLGVN